MRRLFLLLLLVLLPPATLAQGSVEAVKCRACHMSDPPAWKESYHSRMVRPAQDGVLPAALAQWAADARGNAGPRVGNVDGRAYGVDDVVLVLNSKWKQRYLVRVPGSERHQFLDKQWNSYTGVWERYAHRGDWESVCGTCHARGDGGVATLDSGARLAAGPGR
jgi:hypothetical protein